MTLAGHTMGVPELNLFGAIKTFSEIGLDGIEVRCAKDGQLDTETVDDAYLDLARGWLEQYSLSVVCLTSYYRDFVTGRRDSEIRALRRVIDIAATLRCSRIRLYGGTDPPPDEVDRDRAWERTVSGIQEVAAYAEKKGVLCCIETHVGSLTYTAHDAVRMVQDVGRPNVGILLDYAWVYRAGEESIAETLQLCTPYLMHCHCKDWKKEDSPHGQNWRACVMGEGSVPWTEFFVALRQSGYDGTITDEYERYWHMDELPPAEHGMKRNLEFIRRQIAVGGS